MTSVTTPAPTVWSWAASSAPPAAAIPPERANVTSRVRTRFTPKAWAARSLSRMAISTRPVRAFRNPTAAHQATPVSFKNHFAGASHSATIAGTILEINQLHSNLVPAFFGRDREAAAGRRQTELGHQATVFTAASRNPKARRIPQPQFVVIPIGDGRRNDNG